MKVVYVGDNRNRGNLGCRATSTALSQLIYKNHEIVGVVSGKYTNSDNGQLFFYQYYPKWLYKKLGKTNYWNDIKTGIYLFARMIKKRDYFFSNFDFIDYDLDKSIHNLIKCLPANPNLKEMDLRQYDFDALVVNGEGSFIFATPAWRESMVETMLMYWALKMDKKVYYLNGMLSDDPYTEHNSKTINLVKNIFAKLEVVQVREYESLAYANKFFSDSKIVLKPDALFSWYDYINDGFQVENGKYFMGPSGASDRTFWDYDFSKNYICVAGSSAVGLATKNSQDIIDAYIRLVNKIKAKFINYNIYLVEACEGDKFLREVAGNTETRLIPIDTPIVAVAKILANARVFISGRYHPGILATLGGTPCIFMSSNSHKTRSLQELLKYEIIKEYPVLPNENDCNQIVEAAAVKMKQGEKLRNSIKARAKELSDLAKEISDLII